MVRVTGLEPVRLSTQEPKSCTSTNSAIPADNPPFNPSLSIPLQQRKGCVFLFLLIIKQNHSHTLVRIYRRCISAQRLHRLSFPHRWVLLSRYNPWFVKAAPEKKKGGEQSAGLEPARGRTLLLGCIDTNASNHSASSANRPIDVHSLQAAITLHDYGHQWAIIKRC